MEIVTLPNFSVTYALQLVASLVSFAAYVQLRSSFDDSGNVVIGYFSRFFGWLAGFQLLMGAPMLFPVSFSPVKLGAFHIFSHMILYVSFGYLAMAAISAVWPDLREYGFWVNLVMGMVVTYVSILNWVRPEISGLVTDFGVGFPVDVLIGLGSLLNLLVLGGGLFAWLGLDSEGVERWKFWLISLGLVTGSVAGPLHELGMGVTSYLFAGVLTLVGEVLVIAGLNVERVF